MPSMASSAVAELPLCHNGGSWHSFRPLPSLLPPALLLPVQAGCCSATFLLQAWPTPHRGRCCLATFLLLALLTPRGCRCCSARCLVALLTPLRNCCPISSSSGGLSHSRCRSILPSQFNDHIFLFICPTRAMARMGAHNLLGFETT